MRTRTPGDGPNCWCGQPATFGGSCSAHFDSDTGRHTPRDSTRATLAAADELNQRLASVAAGAREAGDVSLAESLLMLRNNRLPGTHIRAELAESVEAEARRAQKGDVVQLNPEKHPRFAGCFAVVDEVRSFGAIVIIAMPGDPSAIIPVRAVWEDFARIGVAAWVRP